jgi:transcriptional regulator with XRE-family HTH domain
MSDERPPARPWYDLVMEQGSIRGWGVAELARRAGVGRPTIYGWRDNANKPQPAPVNAVADALGIPRERALRLAGVIAAAEPESVIPKSLLREIMNTDGLAPDERQAVIDAVAETLARERGGGAASGPAS